MKKIVSIILLFFSIVYVGSCTNDEGGSDLDVIAPNDTSQSKVNIVDLPR